MPNRIGEVMSWSMSRKHLLAGLATAGVLGIGIAAPTMAFAEDNASPNPNTSTSFNRDERRAERRAQVAEALAKELGVSTEQVTAAMDKLRADHQASGQRGQFRDDAAEALAKELGLPVEKVTAALEKVRAEFGPTGRPMNAEDRKERMAERLAQAVEDGKLTQEQADAIIKAVESGVFPGPGGGGPRHGGGFGHGPGGGGWGR